MHKLLLTLLCFIAVQGLGQRTYQIIEDSTTKKPIFKGLISKEVLMYEPSYTWFAPNATNYTPMQTAVDAFKLNGNKVQIVVFGGTWCEDTQNILPKFYKLITAAGFNQAQLTLWGVDRAKTTYGSLTQAFGVTNVPTFIVMQNGKEIGRVVEYGKTGQWDKEIGEVISGVK